MHRRYRLRRSADFERLHRQGRRYYHSLLHLIALRNTLGINRYGFSAGKHIGKAIVRNRAKRLMRESVRHHINEVSVGWDCLFVARRGAADASYNEIEAAVVQLLERAGVLLDSDAT